jgi:2,3-bisphosphoglycerate-dependent phosphoglycerate mutase
VPDLVLLRHGESAWNAEDRFTGWTDVDLTPRGEREARQAGRALAAARTQGLELHVVHTSLLTRAVRTATLALEELGTPWLPVRRHWRLNERHYGDLQGRNKRQTAERYGTEQVRRWRRSYTERPPTLGSDDPRHPLHDPRYADLPASALPAGESLEDVVRRVVPYFEDAIAADLVRFGGVLVVAHGNSLRALAKHLEGIDDESIIDFELPTGVPRHYEIGPRGRVVAARFLELPGAHDPA